MRIEPTGTPAIASKPVGSAPRTTAAATDSASVGAGEAGSFSLSGDLASLLAAVRRTPEVRAEAIETAAALLAGGQLDTPEAAADVARALLADPPAPPSE